MQNYTLKSSAKGNILKINKWNRNSSLPVPSSQNTIVTHRFWFSRFTVTKCFQLGIYLIQYWEAIVWRSLKQNVALCSYAQMPNAQLPSQPLLN